MAQAKQGSRAGWAGNVVDLITTSVTLLASDSGKTFLCAGCTVTLPSASAAGAGWHAKFIYKSGSSTVSGVTINATGECCDVVCDGSAFYAGIGHQA